MQGGLTDVRLMFPYRMPVSEWAIDRGCRGKFLMSVAFKAERGAVRSVQRRTGGFAHGSILGFGLDVAGNVAQGSQALNPNATVRGALAASRARQPLRCEDGARANGHGRMVSVRG